VSCSHHLGIPPVRGGKEGKNDRWKAGQEVSAALRVDFTTPTSCSCRVRRDARFGALVGSKTFRNGWSNALGVDLPSRSGCDRLRRATLSDFRGTSVRERWPMSIATKSRRCRQTREGICTVTSSVDRRERGRTLEWRTPPMSYGAIEVADARRQTPCVEYCRPGRRRREAGTIGSAVRRSSVGEILRRGSRSSPSGPMIFGPPYYSRMGQAALPSRMPRITSRGPSSSSLFACEATLISLPFQHNCRQRRGRAACFHPQA